MISIERMTEFFEARIDEYDEHMVNDVEGCREGYELMAELIPEDCTNLLDLGCGTGLELDYIFRKHSEISVTGIDLTQAMLDRLACKYPEKCCDKSLDLICGDYFSTDFGLGRFDCAVSFETMHHFTCDKKIGLYRRICGSLKNGGVYIECDYMVDTQEEEDFFFAENDRLRKENGITEEVFCHFDTPCTIKNQIEMLVEAGFEDVKLLFRKGGTAMISARKHN